MRKRKYLIGLTAALATCVAASSTALAAPTGQTMTVSMTPTKQSASTPGGSTIDVVIATQHTFGNAAQTASNTVLDFDKGLSFNPGNLAECNPTALTGTTTDQAKAVCGSSQVGSGDATLCSGAGGCGALQSIAVVTAFNGVPNAGNPVLLLHTKPGAPIAATPPSILQGNLIPSPVGGKYGKRLDVTVPDTNPLTLTNFHTNVPKTQTVPKNKKKNKPAKFYVMAKCTDKVWDFQETTTFRAGAGTQSATATQNCTKKPKKKKKKKK